MKLYNAHVVTRAIASAKDEALNYPPMIQPRFIASQWEHFKAEEAHILAHTYATATA
jgi:hypothetical protein